MAVVRLVRQWADRKAATPVQISLAWLMAQKPFIVPIPGSTKRHHVAENFGAVNVKFTPEELQEFGSQLSGIPIVGNRSTDQATRDQ
jgi:aryl-alcohol dehydrogenase-like predicted oxidoreductase